MAYVNLAPLLYPGGIIQCIVGVIRLSCTCTCIIYNVYGVLIKINDGNCRSWGNINELCFALFFTVTQICGAYPLVPFSEADILDKVHV